MSARASTLPLRAVGFFSAVRSFNKFSDNVMVRGKYRPAQNRGRSTFSNATVREPVSSGEGKRGPAHLSTTKFADLPISQASIDAVTNVMKFECLTMVQDATLPAILKGKDVLAKAKTGTGKTVAFLLPSVEHISLKDRERSNPKNISMLVISPTRELAAQISKEAEMLLSCHPNLKALTMYGGTNINSERKRLESSRIDILVATPGRLIDHLENTPVLLKRLKPSILVLDEADQLLEMGFRREIEKIIKYLPQERQTLLFSATMPQSVQKVAGLALRHDHEFIDTVDEDTETNVQVAQGYMVTSMDDQMGILATLLQQETEKDKNAKIIVFFTTARLTQYTASLMEKMRVLSADIFEIHSRKSQSAREKASASFRNARSAILFTSDVSARGVDYPDVSLVLQVGIPASAEQYIHRLGRTARAGKEGKGLLLVNDFEKSFVTKALAKLPLEKAENPPVHESIMSSMSRAFGQVDPKIPVMAYQSWLGYYNSYKGIFPDKSDLVSRANQFSSTIGLSEPPALMKKTIGKMGLKGVPGLRIEGDNSIGNNRNPKRSNFQRNKSPRKRTESIGDPSGHGRRRQ